MQAEEIEAPVVGVTVYPDRARVTRRGSTRLPAGEHRVRVAPLPLGVRRDSLRVGGRGAVTVLGVDVATWRQPRSTDAQVRALEQRSRELADELAEVDDAHEIEVQRGQFLTRLADRAGGTYARALACGDAVPTDVAAFADSVAGQLADSQRRRRELVRRRTDLAEEMAAVERELSAASGKRAPDRLAAEVTVSVDADDAELDLELTYLVDGARWQPSYDLRLVDDTMTVTCFGLVSQDTGEDWPECVLELSTARPAAATGVPELAPWYLDRVRPLPPSMPMAAASFGAMPAPAAPGAAPAGAAARS
ncbi:mucoidy inhibitor MuiA family protein, partial [Micromonospora sp. CPCC 205546]|uniref:mucoidy inhibitor MuiA family protein n=1 Tax=Micromonospora sp. CPCC 205546 TaxID=3122397 RepID=UPI002FF38380